mgnify:CR=1 FL=1
MVIEACLPVSTPIFKAVHHDVLFVLLFCQLTYSTTRYGLYEVVTAELKKTNGKLLLYYTLLPKKILQG